MQLQKCIGSAVSAMGPESFLTLVPISLNEHSYTYLNIWLVPILKHYITGASLAYYMEHIMPLAKSFKKASRKGIFATCFFNKKWHAKASQWRKAFQLCRHLKHYLFFSAHHNFIKNRNKQNNRMGGKDLTYEPWEII